MPEYRVIDMSASPRKAHFDYFRGMGYPYIGLTVNVDITDFLKAVKQNGFSFFLSFLYCAAKAVNNVPQLRQRIRGDGVVEYASCPTSHTVALDDGTYCYCTLDCAKPFDVFLPYAAEAQEKAKTERSLDDGEDADSLIFVSCLPWTSYTSLVQPVPLDPPDSNPRVTWGRYFEQDGKTLLPVTLLVNHALADGLHISQFYSELDKALAEI